MSSNVDGAGLAKLETLEQAVTHVQRLNTVVERMAQAARMMQPLTAYRQQIQRTASPLVGLLKPQFETISNIVANLILISTRGGSDQQKVRGLRESVAQIRVQIESAESKVLKQHAIGGSEPARLESDPK